MASCLITKKKTIIGNSRSHSMHSTKRKFIPNLHYKKFWIPSIKKYIRLCISAKGIRIIKKNGIENILNKLNIKYYVKKKI